MRDEILIGTTPGRLAVPAAFDPVGLDVVGREFQFGEPLRRRHVAVEPGHDGAHREAVLGQQRLAVHADHQHRLLAGRPQHVQRRAEGEAVDGVPDHLLGAALDARPVEQVHQRHADEVGRRDVGPADLVGHARHGDRLLDQRHRSDVVEGELDRLVDHAGDAQRGVLGAQLRHLEVDVDPVEVRGGREERRRAEFGERGARGDRRCRCGRHQFADRLPRRRDVDPAGQGEAAAPATTAPTAAASEPSRKRRRPSAASAAPSAVGRRPCRRAGRCSHQNTPTPATSDGGGSQQPDGSDRLLAHGQRADDADDDDGDETGHDAAPRRQPDHHADQGQHDGHADQQRRLVVGAEVPDREVLDRRGRPVDGGVADREERRRRRQQQQPRDQVARSEGGDDGDHPGGGGADGREARGRREVMVVIRCRSRRRTTPRRVAGMRTSVRRVCR